MMDTSIRLLQPHPPATACVDSHPQSTHVRYLELAHGLGLALALLRRKHVTYEAHSQRLGQIVAISRAAEPDLTRARCHLLRRHCEAAARLITLSAALAEQQSGHVRQRQEHLTQRLARLQAGMR
jgi:hypothetical protein